MEWGDIAALSYFDGDGVSGLDLDALRGMVAKSPEESLAARRMLVFWLDLNGDDPDQVQRVVCPKYIGTIAQVLQQGAREGPAAAARLRPPPCGALPPSAAKEADFLLSLRSMRDGAARGELPAAFGHAAYADPVRGGIASAAAASKRRLLQALVDDSAFLAAVAGPLRVRACAATADAGSSAGAVRALRFVQEALLLARRCGDEQVADSLGAALCCASVGVAQASAALLSSRLRPLGAELLLQVAQTGPGQLGAVREAVAAQGKAFAALAAGCRAEPTSEEALLSHLLLPSGPSCGSFADLFAGHALPCFSAHRPCAAAWRLAAAWVRCRSDSRGARRFLGELLRAGAGCVSAAATCRGVSGCAAVDALRLASDVAARRSRPLRALLLASGIGSAAQEAVTRPDTVTEGGLLYQAAARLLAAPVYRTGMDAQAAGESDDSDSDVSDGLERAARHCTS